MYSYQQQPHTNDIETKPIEGVIYEFDYGPNGKKQHYKTGDKIKPEQDAIIMAIPREETKIFDKENRQYVWFQCRICGKLAYGTIHQAKNKNSERYNPCGCHKKQSSSETGKRTGPKNCQHFIEWARSEEGRAHSSKIGKTIGCKNIIYAQQYCKEHPEHHSNIGKRTIQYALEGLKKWQKEHPEEVHLNQQKATQAATKWRKEHPDKFKENCAQHYAKLRASAIPSAGEQLVIDYLAQNGILFCKEFPIKELLGPHNKPRRLDFMLLTDSNENLAAIEVNGAQHYVNNHLFEQTSNDKFTIKEIDKMKAQWCQKQNIPLYAIDARNLSTVIIQLQNILKEVLMAEVSTDMLDIDEELDAMGQGDPENDVEITESVTKEGDAQ